METTFSGKLGERNSLIANLGRNFQLFPKSCQFVPRVRSAYWGSSSQSFMQ